jgi:hypothetical protein
MSWNNLDLKCALAAESITQRIANGGKQELEKLCVDAGSVASENGPYAFFLYLWARHRKDQKKSGSITAPYALLQGTFRLLDEVIENQALPGDRDMDFMMKQVADMGQELEKLLLARKLIQQVVSYARYHSKAFEQERVRVASPGGKR